MKKLSLIIFFLLTLQNLSYADTISEYEEAGLKLGKSILEVMTFEKIIESVVERSKDERYLTVEYVPDTSVYPSLDFNYYLITIDMSNDELKIASFTAMEYLPNDFEGCVKKQNIYANKFEKILRIKKEIIPIRDFSDLYGAGSKWRAIIFEYPVKANAASVLCYHYGDFPEENNLKINFFTRDYADSITID
tara:strand:+ start:76 stop:651 length:576 start_codon:yes stop_codon:yes gene_type:complete